MKKILLFMIVLTCLIKNNSTAQYWSPLGTGMPYGDVKTLFRHNGVLYAGGAFDSAGSVMANHIAQWDGTNWSALGAGIRGDVFAIAHYNGELYVGGCIDSAGGTPVSNIAKWNGSNWSAVGSGLDNWVYSIAVYNGELYAGGYFLNAGSSPANHIAKWNGTNWSPVGSGINDVVICLLVHNGSLYAGGGFTNAGGNPAYYVARWNGTNWFDVGTGMDYYVLCLAEYNGELVAAGWFSQAGGSSASQIAKWDGTNWSPLGSGLGGGYLGYGVQNIAVYDNALYAGGEFDHSGNIPLSNFAKWNGFEWSNPGNGTNHFTFALAASDTAIFVGGLFHHVGDSIPANLIAKWIDYCSIPQPGSIIGNNSVCIGTTQTYSVSPVNGASSYTWILPPGWTGNSTTNSITAVAGANSGNISVTANNSCGSSSPQTLAVTANPLPPTPDPISGNIFVCENSLQTYSIPPVSDASDYTWTLPPGWTGSSTTSSIIVTAGSNEGNISVKANNFCGSSMERILIVKVDTVLANPNGINGDNFVFVNKKDAYSTNLVNGATGYTWSLSGGGTIVTGQNTNTIIINWHTPGEYTLSVNGSNSCGPGRNKLLKIRVSAFNVEDPFSIQLLPNPSSGEFYLIAKRIQEKVIKVEVMNMSGQVVYKKSNLQGTNNYSQLLNLSMLAQGLYIVKIVVDEKVYIRKIVINR